MATSVAFVLLGREIAQRRAALRGPLLQTWSAAFTIGSCLWIASVWMVALLHQLTRPVMLARSAAVIAAALLLWWLRTRREERQPHDAELSRTLLLPMLPVLAWIAFVFWRSGIVPPLSHDALAYHLPRAVLWIREHGYSFLQLPIDARTRILPANYELLVADTILLAGGDWWTELVGLFFYAGFVVTAGALAERWWPERRETHAAVMLLTAAVPVLLLHAGADKNDSMTGFFMLSALLWCARWFGDADLHALLLCGVSAVAATGTKPQGLMLGAAAAPWVAWRVVTEWRARRLRIAGVAAIVLLVLVSSLLLGGAFFVSKAMHDTSVDVDTGRGGGSRAFVRYDDWANLWQAPWVLLTAPLSRSDDLLWVPWSAQPWFWKRHEIYFSDLGLPFVVAVLLLPFVLWRFRDEERRGERLAVGSAAVVTLLLMLPVRDVPMPHGVYTVALPRYVMFLAPVVFALAIAPALQRMARHAPKYAQLAVWIFAAWFLHEAADNAVNDSFVPIEYVMEARQHPGTRVIAFSPWHAASVVDRIAPQSDTIAFDAGYGAWIHPAFGATLARPVVFLDSSRGEVAIPQAARWVIVDREFRRVWQHPEFRDLSQWPRYLNRGPAQPRDLVVLRQMLRDPRFETIYLSRRGDQAVFRRR